VIARFEEERTALLDHIEGLAAEGRGLKQQLAAATDRGALLEAELGALRESAQRREGALMQV